ncbi:DUF2000 domain-containing protein [Saccharopolyspora sp. NPDC047091]|uniref:DUF2000 domain-containing protein n=1 Tax=Saccharopolyspora sp. NPDC047091 TaxID=3155924 RepID=UPI00340037CB
MAQTKIAVVVRDDLAGWQRLNVTAFLSSGITAAHPELVGEPYADADDVGYLPLLGRPVLVYTADAERLRQVHRKALDRGMRPAIYTAQMFTTGDDDANRAVVRAVPTAGLDLVGIALHDGRNQVDKVCKGLGLHP